MSNDHVAEPLRSILNRLDRSHREAHAELREGLAALERAAAMPSRRTVQGHVRAMLQKVREK